MFITTLPILFAFTHLLNPLEISIFFLAILVVVYLMTPNPTHAYAKLPSGSLYDYLFSSWSGTMPLRWAFWPFFILINAVFIYIDYRIAADTYTINSWKTVHLMVFLPVVWWVLSVWRCVANCRLKIWSSIACAMTIYLIFDFILRITLSIQFPNTLFNCRLLLIEYGDCF